MSKFLPADQQGNEAYDYDDEFIDDAEIMEMYNGDRRKPKQTGFYINVVRCAWQRLLHCIQSSVSM